MKCVLSLNKVKVHMARPSGSPIAFGLGLAIVALFVAAGGGVGGGGVLVPLYILVFGKAYHFPVACV